MEFRDRVALWTFTARSTGTRSYPSNHSNNQCFSITVKCFGQEASYLDLTYKAAEVQGFYVKCLRWRRELQFSVAQITEGCQGASTVYHVTPLQVLRPFCQVYLLVSKLEMWLCFAAVCISAGHILLPDNDVN